MPSPSCARRSSTTGSVLSLPNLRDTFQVNFFSAAEFAGWLCGSGTPATDARVAPAATALVLISSMGRWHGMHFSSGYNASKAALSIWGESLDMELRQRGSRRFTVTIVEPGLFASGMTRPTPLTRLLFASRRQVASRIVSGALAGRQAIRPPFAFALLTWAACLMGRDFRYRLFARAKPGVRSAMTPATEGACLIVNADDYGYFRCVSKGILQAATHGIVTATGVFATAPQFAEHAAWLRDCEALDVGVHLNLTDGNPLTNDMRKALARWSGRFPAKFSVAMAIVSGAIGIDDVRLEWRAQIERCLEAGLRVSFLNSHEHLHMLPALFPVASALAGEYGIAHVRFPTIATRLGSDRRCDAPWRDHEGARDDQPPPHGHAELRSFWAWRPAASSIWRTSNGPSRGLARVGSMS